MKNLLTLAIFLLFNLVECYAFPIKIKSSASSFSLMEAKQEAMINSRKAMIRENEKIFLAWTDAYFPNSNFNFNKIAHKISLKSNTVRTKEKISKSKKNGYTVTYIIEYSVRSEEIANQIIEIFEIVTPKNEFKKLGINKVDAIKSLTKIIDNW